MLPASSPVTPAIPHAATARVVVHPVPNVALNSHCAALEVLAAERHAAEIMESAVALLDVATRGIHVKQSMAPQAAAKPDKRVTRLSVVPTRVW